MDVLNIFFLLFAGLIAGFVNTVAGGGSLLTLPLLIFMGLPPSVANGTNRVAIFMQNIFATAGFKSKGVFVFPYSLWLGLSATLGAYFGSKMAIDISGDVFKKILSVIMILVLMTIIFKPKLSEEDKKRDLSLKEEILGSFLFFFVGIYGGFIQAGVGFIMLAVLSRAQDFSLAKANSIKVFVVLIYTMMALIIFSSAGKINWILGGVLGIGNAAGGWMAGRWSADRPDKTIKIILSVVVCIMAIRLWFF